MISTVLRRRVLPQGLRTSLSTHIIRCYASYPPHTVIKMPALSPTMTAGGIGAWQKKAGDSIAPGDVLVEIETDKAQMDFEFQEEGCSRRQRKPPIFPYAHALSCSLARSKLTSQPIAVLVEEGTDVSAFEGFSAADAGGDAPAPAPKKEEKSESSSSASESAPTPAPEPEDNGPAGKLEPAINREPNASIGAVRLAREKGVKVADIKGTGKGGQITEEDVKKAASSPAAASSSASAAYEDIPISGMRKTIANRLQEPQRLERGQVQAVRQRLPHQGHRRRLQEGAPGNSSWRGDVIRQSSTVDVSVAVSTPTGLITPIVTGVEARGLESISSQVKQLAKLARDGKLKPEQYQGGTISISNMGMNPAVDNFTAIINPPQSTILAIGTTQKVAVPVENEDGTTGFEWDEQLKVTGSFDHKVVDGAIGAEWLKEFKKVLENPLQLLL
ncbi:pyruvate dehydrogenase protein X component [Verticillium alfalfae VaMs.102]|uniref:Dihydrolipoamide acetyltransferase component of pyruvate dehydrogenase complex n=1 Tax=Verticillium alfalfae (strain VaMs.102 / ATCC MYA-4576 / FGSC 10136) TaxID=526221 RepID=C9SU78_VERA1|nr:pyruvate dehydrogenase protein X component [Verticillium alfalfae VaMs.102]EEY22389.1 pyruvate dehydrogenase protein X component [Verticillium alfalfae VaMs.102]